MKIGDTCEVTGVVTAENTAASFGSGGLPVFGTPYLVAIMECAAYMLMQKDLPEGKSSVGTKLDIAHVSPSPIGMRIRAVAEAVDVSDDGKFAEFRVTAYDDAGLIGEGTHKRAVITVERFMNKCMAKLGQ